MDEATRISLKDQFNSLLVQAIEGRRGGMALMRVLEELDFYNSPASAKHHLNVPGGLVMHSLNVARAALELCDKMPQFAKCNKGAVLTAALLHDVCKAGQYMGTDGMPRGGTPGDSTAAMACRMDELGIGDQLRQLERQRAVLLEDQNIIRGQMNRLDSGHNLILTEFYISHKKWHEVQQKVPYSVQHLKYLRNVALAQLGRNLERLPECAALLSRALNTREGQRRADAWAEGDILL